MMEINTILFFVVIIASYIAGTIMGTCFTRDYRKLLEKEYNEKHKEIYNTVRRETREEWSKGWDAAYRQVGNTQRAYYLWFQEHGYEKKDIDKWLENYMKK